MNKSTLTRLLGALILLTLSAPASAVSPGLVAYLTGDGNAVDTQGNLNLVSGTASYGSGVFGQAFSFSGSSGLNFSYTGLPLGSTDRTLEFWVQRQSPVASEDFFAGYGQFGSYNRTFHSGTYGAGTSFVSSWGPGVSGPTLAVGDWEHIAITRSSGLVRLYVNSVLANQGSLSGINTLGGFFQLGYVDGGRRMHGFLDDIALYDRALSVAEIQADMAEGVLPAAAPVSEPSLAAALKAFLD